MISRYRVALGGVQMDSLEKDMMILDVSYPAMKPGIDQNRIANQDGYDYTDEYVDKNTVTVTFELHIYDIAKRNAACQKINEWAQQGGTLIVNERDGQCLRNVRCERYANINSAQRWTDPLTIVFATTYIPFWQSKTEKALTLSGKSAKGKLNLDGNTRSALVSVEVTAAAEVSSFQITVGETTIKLTGLSLAAGKKLIIDSVRSRYLRIRADGKSVMARMAASSADVLLAPCGTATAVSYTSNSKVTAVIKARGLWL